MADSADRIARAFAACRKCLNQHVDIDLFIRKAGLPQFFHQKVDLTTFVFKRMRHAVRIDWTPYDRRPAFPGKRGHQMCIRDRVNPLWLMGRSDEKSPLPAMGVPDTIEYVLEPSMPQQKSSPSQEDNELDPLDKRLMDFVSTLTVDQKEFLLAQLQTMIQLKKEIPPSQDS